MKKLFILFIALILCFSMVACSSQTESQDSSSTPNVSESANNPATKEGDVFTIFTYLTLSGTGSNGGIPAKNSIDLAVKYVNDNGGFNGVPVKIVHYDNQGSTEETVKIVQKIIESGEADAVIGSTTSTENLAAVPYLNDAGIWNYGLGTSATWMENPDDIWTFRACVNNSRMTPSYAGLVKSFGYDTVAVFSTTDDNNTTTSSSFVEACADAGVSVVSHVQADPNDTDFTGQISKILDSDPDTVFIFTLAQTNGPFVTQLRNFGYKGVICFKDGWTQEYANIVGSEGSNYIAAVVPYVTYNSVEECEIPNVKDFVKRYYDEYGVTPEMDLNYRAWDTVMAMWETSKVAGSNEMDALREANHKVAFDGLGGPIDFTAGDREGLNSYNSFIFYNDHNVLLADWLENGGYEDYLAATGRDR